MAKRIHQSPGYWRLREPLRNAGSSPSPLRGSLVLLTEPQRALVLLSLNTEFLDVRGSWCWQALLCALEDLWVCTAHQKEPLSVSSDRVLPSHPDGARTYNPPASVPQSAGIIGILYHTQLKTTILKEVVMVPMNNY